MLNSFLNCRWTDANTAEFSSPDEIHIWKIALFEPQPGELEMLSQDEVQRMQKFKNKTAQKTYLCSRLAMRRLFSSYLKQPASELKFNTTQQGKPFLVDYTTELKFNLSHSGELILLAVSPSLELGIDVEQHKSIQNWEKIAKKVFDNNIIQQLKLEISPETAFINAWTRYEAMQKLHGAGIFGKPLNTTMDKKSLNIPIENYEASLSYSPAPTLTKLQCFNYCH